MNIPKYWADAVRSATDPSGRPFRFRCWHWSNSSQAEAAEGAARRAAELASRIQLGRELGRYPYSERPLREEIKQSVTTPDGKEVGLVTRNGYGVLVLNAASAMFVDIDFYPDDPRTAPAGNFVDGIKRLFGSAASTPADRAQSSQLARVEDWVRGHPGLDVRLYRTFAGFRCLITNCTFDATSGSALEILSGLHADPLYIKLCKDQQCFRARLTAKPWRCNADKPPSRYPWTGQEEELEYRQWEQKYTLISSGYSACRFLTQYGNGAVHPEVQPILELHDEMACSVGNATLA